MLRVLVVEDDEDTAANLAMVLQIYGCDVRVAADGPSALHAVQVYSPNVVLLDVGRPEIDGWEVAKQIRKHHGKRLVLIGVTAHGTEEDRLRSLAADIDGHLVKPVNLGELEDLLKAIRSVGGDTEQPAAAP